MPSFEPDIPPDVRPNQEVKSSARKDMLAIAGVLCSALLLAFFLISFVFQSYQVDGPSMQPTLHHEDHLLVWKLPKSFASLTNQNYVPNRGDVIIIHGVTVPDKQLIKRVVGLPGDRVVVKDGQATVYGPQHAGGYNPDRSLPYGEAIATTSGSADVTLADNEVYVLGDNRTNSKDSRSFGPVSSDKIIGKLLIRVLPLNSVKVF